MPGPQPYGKRLPAGAYRTRPYVEIDIPRRGGFYIRPEALRLPLCLAGDQWSPLQGGYSVVVSDEDDAIPDVFSVGVGSCVGTDDASGCSGEGTTGVSGCGDSTGGGSTGAGFSGGKGL